MTRDYYPKVTIVTVVKNIVQARRTEHMRQCIESVRGQDYVGEIEHLIIDGESNDGTLEFLAEFQSDNDFKVLSQRDDGIYDAMNIGFRKATGKYVAFLNSDDYFAKKDAISKSVEALEQASADFSFGNYRLVTQDGEIKSLRTHELGLFFYRMPFNHQTMFVNKEAASKVNFFNSAEYRSAGDYDFVVRLILAGARGIYVNHELIHFREGGYSSEVERTQNECLKLLFDAFYKLNNLSKEETKALFFEGIIPKKLFARLLEITDKSVSNYMNKSCLSFIDEGDKLIYAGQRMSTYFNETSQLDDLSGLYVDINLLSLFINKIRYRFLKTILIGEKRKYYQTKYRMVSFATDTMQREHIKICGLPIVTVYKYGISRVWVICSIPIYVSKI